ncbi:MAG: PbpA [Desulfobacter sp.]|nr:PbpA [Desulfobacter sp.]WDP86530.1 MAG: PbpA [Desulfobacter sp.]
MYTFKKENSWQKLQSDFLLQRRKKSLILKSARVGGLVLAIAGLGLAGLFLTGYFFPEKQSPGPTPPTAQSSAKAEVLSKPALKIMTRNLDILNSPKDHFFVDTPAQSYTVYTGLDTRLQALLGKTLDRLQSRDRGKPQRIAMVAMDGSTGLIKAMAGFDLADPKANPCTAADYPAASIFKIVTASAAVDALGYSPATSMYFNGNKYTLYKRQLTEKKNRYTYKISLGRAFAESINPVFGKLGKLYLGKKKLNTYAHEFGFNQGPETDFDFESSAFSLTQSDYHLAELGCGFNRDTQISPIFGAMLVSPIINQGHSLVPRLVDRVTDLDGKLIYKSQKEVFKIPVGSKTALTMIELMKQTISKGTARKAFRGYSRDKVLSGLIIGGKTGSLFNRERTVKYDWFTGFGRDKKSGETLVVTVVVGHRKYIGTRASTHAKNMLKTYFKPIPTNHLAPGTRS